MKPLDARNKIHARNDDYLSLSTDEAAEGQKTVALFIGVLAIGLAAGVNILDIQYGPTCARSSISHYFYEPVAGTFFVMVLSFVAAFLVAYRGENKWDGRLATLAGIAALVVAFMPTSGVGCAGDVDVRLQVIASVADGRFQTVPFDGAEHLVVRPEVPLVVERAADAWDPHLIAAGILFAILLYFSAIVFTRVRPDVDLNGDGSVKRAKVVRNLIYTGTSLGMLVGFALIGLDEMLRETLGMKRPVFWGEAIGLVCFGVAWLTKGRFWFGWLDSEKA